MSLWRSDQHDAVGFVMLIAYAGVVTNGFQMEGLHNTDSQMLTSA